MTDGQAARRKLRLFNLNLVRTLTDGTAAGGDVTSVCDLRGTPVNNAMPTSLRRSHTLHLGATHGTTKDGSSIMRILPRLRPEVHTSMPTTLTISGRRNSYTDDSADSASPPLPSAYAHYLKRASHPLTSTSSAVGGDMLRQARTPRPEDRRSRVSRIFSDLSRKRASVGDNGGLHVTHTPFTSPQTTSKTTRVLQPYVRGPPRRQQDRVYYDPRPQDVVEKCERWVASLPATFAKVGSVISIPDSCGQLTDMSDMDSEDIDRLTQSGFS